MARFAHGTLAATIAAVAVNGFGVPERPVWDFIVAGAGTGGALCAARLAESGASVLLLEAGKWDQSWIYRGNSGERDIAETVWGYPIRLPKNVQMQNSPEFRFRVAAGRIPGGSSTVHQDIYNRPPLREFEYFGFKSWNEDRVARHFKNVEADLGVEFFGEESIDNIPDPQFIVLDKLLTRLDLPHRARPHQDGKAGGASIGWWMYRSCPANMSHGLKPDYGKPGCRRHTSYWNMVAGRNTTLSNQPLPITTLPNSLVKRVLIEDGRAIGVEVLRNGRLHEVFAERAVVLGAGALGTPKILTLSGVGDPYELQRLGVPIQFANREVGNGLKDHFATFTWFLLRGDNDTKFEGPACEDKEFFHTFFNLTEPYAGGDGLVDAEVRYFTGCNQTRRTVDFGIEAVLLHPKSQGRVVVSSNDPEVLPYAEFPSLWEDDYDSLVKLLGRISFALDLRPDDMSAEPGMSLDQSVRKSSYMYQHLCCSARAALDGEPGVCDEHLRVRGISNLYVADASALPKLSSSHTSSAVLLLAGLAAEHMLANTSPHPLPARSGHNGKDALEALLADAPAGGPSRLTSPTVELPIRVAASDSSGLAPKVQLPLTGLGTGTIARHRVTGAVATFLRVGGRHLDTAAMYENYADVRAGIEASGLADLSEIVITGKMMPLGRQGVRSAIDEALTGLGVKHLDVALLHWPGDISSGKLMHGKPAPQCTQALPNGNISWARCRTESYAALLEERDAGRVRAVGVSNFAPHHLDALEREGFPLPAVHQLELHPFWSNDVLLKRHAADGTQVMAFGCLGGAHTGAPLLRQQGFKKIGERFEKASAQVLFRWAVQHGAAVIAGGTSDAHLKQNLDIFDFELTDDDMEFMDSNAPEAMSKMYGPKPEEIL